MSIGRVPGSTGIQPTIVDAKGDLIVATAADSVSRQAVGSNNQTLYADSAQSTGVAWGASAKSTLTTTGDILYASSANTLARLGVGSSGQVLTVSGGVPAWGSASTPAFVGCRVSKTATQTISNSTWTTVTWDTEVFDTDGFHDNSTNNSRITIPSGKGGKYLFFVQIRFNANSTGTRSVNMNRNGTLEYQLVNYSAPSSGNGQSTVSMVVDASAGDYFYVDVNQTSGGNITIDYSQGVISFGCAYLGA